MKFKIGLCQMKVSFDKAENRATAERLIRQAAAQGAQLISLPEMWNCPYSNDYFREYAEDSEGESVRFLSGLAKELGIYLIGGSIPELEDGRVYNTCFAFDRSGCKIGRHRKAHLFDIDIEGGIRFMESDTLTPGDTATVIDTELCRVGVAICYDIRFPELTRRMALDGARLVILPGAFNMTTGPAHWDLSIRARALDNQVYFAAVSPARDKSGPYEAYGNSCIASPWGAFVAHADEKENVLIGEVDTDYVEAIRGQLPLLKHRRPELY